jgi:hypothetical protein
MARKLLIALMVLTAALAAGSCSREGSESADASDSDSPRGAGVRRVGDEGVEPSEAARARGVQPQGDRDAAEEAEPQIAIRSLTYEWRVAPEKGLHLTIDFVNTRETYARARGYLFVVASSTTAPSAAPGIYPWDARFDGKYPEKHTDGTRLLFRDEMDARIFIPYRAGDGYYDHIRILVYREEGGITIDLDYDLDITGEPSGPIEAAPMSVTM